MEDKAQIGQEIVDALAQLSATDYQAIKHSEGLIYEEDYAPIKAQRQALRDRVNERRRSWGKKGWRFTESAQKKCTFFIFFEK